MSEPKMFTMQRDLTAHSGYGVATGSANALLVNIKQAQNTYEDGMFVSFKPAYNSTGPATINVNGLGVRTIKKASGEDVDSDDLKAGSIYSIRYNANTSFFILQGEGGNKKYIETTDITSPINRYFPLVSSTKLAPASKPYYSKYIYDKNYPEYYWLIAQRQTLYRYRMSDNALLNQIELDFRYWNSEESTYNLIYNPVIFGEFLLVSLYQPNGSDRRRWMNMYRIADGKFISQFLDMEMMTILKQTDEYIYFQRFEKNYLDDKYICKFNKQNFSITTVPFPSGFTVDSVKIRVITPERILYSSNRTSEDLAYLTDLDGNIIPMSTGNLNQLKNHDNFTFVPEFDMYYSVQQKKDSYGNGVMSLSYFTADFQYIKSVSSSISYGGYLDSSTVVKIAAHKNKKKITFDFKTRQPMTFDVSAQGDVDIASGVVVAEKGGLFSRSHYFDDKGTVFEGFNTIELDTFKNKYVSYYTAK